MLLKGNPGDFGRQDVVMHPPPQIYFMGGGGGGGGMSAHVNTNTDVSCILVE